MTNRFFLGVALLGALVWAGQGYAAPVSADGAQPGAFPASVIAIIDVQRILQESDAAKSVQHQLEAQRAKFQSEIAGEETGLRKTEEDLAKAHDNVTAEVYTDREQKLRQRFLMVERHVQARRRALDQALTESMDVVRKAVLKIVADTARAHGANLVVVKQQTLWSDAKIDITDDVLSRLNKALPEVTVQIKPEEAEEKEEASPANTPSKPLKR